MVDINRRNFLYTLGGAAAAALVPVNSVLANFNVMDKGNSNSGVSLKGSIDNVLEPFTQADVELALDKKYTANGFGVLIDQLGLGQYQITNGNDGNSNYDRVFDMSFVLVGKNKKDLEGVSNLFYKSFNDCDGWAEHGPAKNFNKGYEVGPLDIIDKKGYVQTEPVRVIGDLYGRGNNYSANSGMQIRVYGAENLSSGHGAQTPLVNLKFKGEEFDKAYRSRK